MCEFCDKDDFEKQIVYTSSSFFVLLPRKPKSAGHLMLVPKKHTDTMGGMASEDAQDFVEVIRHISEKAAMREGDKYLGYNTLSNNGGISVGQHVPHFHMHMFLRYRNEDYSPLEVLAGKIEARIFSGEEHKQLVEELSTIYT